MFFNGIRQIRINYGAAWSIEAFAEKTIHLHFLPLLPLLYEGRVVIGEEGGDIVFLLLYF